MSAYINPINATTTDVRKTGVLLVNLGTPSAPTPRALKKYLREFLSDPRVVELPRVLWLPILWFIILPFRASYSAKLYQKIWTEQGSPLLSISRLQQQALQDVFDQRMPSSIVVALGMRYGSPSIAQALDTLRAHNVERVVVLPLYPQYASATVGSIFDVVARELSRWRVAPELHFITHYADNPQYIQVLAHHIRQHWQRHPPGERLLFSFHGLPQRQVDAGDPYYQQCQRTAQSLAGALDYPSDKWLLVFQSRFGRAKWLQPYLDPTLQTLVHTGVKRVDIVCPGFAADCLETLEEINCRSHELFMAAGGKQLNYIPALNASAEHIAMLADIVMATAAPRHQSR